MGNCDNMDSQRMSIVKENLTDPEISIRTSENPTVSRNVSYQSHISTIAPDNNNLSKKLKILDNFGEENVPLRGKLNAKFKQPNHRKHSCTDVHCLIIFICFIAAWVYIAGYAFAQGNLNNVLIPSDSKNIKCGFDSGVRNKKMLFFFNLDKCLDPMVPLTGCNTKQICVETCPQISFVFQESKIKQATDLTLMKERLICDSIVDKRSLKSLADVKTAIQNDYCSGWYLKSKALFNHCVWDFSENVCNILPKGLTGRKRRAELSSSNLIDISPFKDKIAKFLEFTKSMCSKARDNASLDFDLANVDEKLQQSNSNFNQIIGALFSKFNYNGKQIAVENITTDLKNSWKVLMIAFLIHLATVLLFIILLRWLAGPLVWIAIGAVIIGLTFSFIYSFNQYRNLINVPHHATNLMANILESADVWFYVTVVLGAFLTIILLIVLVIRKRIKIAVAIIKEASKAVTNIKSSIFFPIFPGILYIVVATVSVVVMLYLSSIGEFSFIVVRRNSDSGISVKMEKCNCAGPMPKPYEVGDICNPALFEEFCYIENDTSKSCVQTSCSLNTIVKSQKTKWFMLFNIFCFLWVTFFISAYEDMVLACTFSIWYWTFNKNKLPKLPLLKAIWITTFYHMGTLAFGSLILTICRMIRYVLELIEKKVKMYNNVITRFIIRCMRCFFWVLEKFLRFLNKNAYITCAIHSTSFCESSKKAFLLITENILRVYAVDRVSDFLLFITKVLVTGCTSCATYYFLEAYPAIIPMHYKIVPVALVAVSSYIISCFIFSTFSMAIDTLFFCFLEDSTENNGSAESPFYMSKELNKLLGKSNTKRKHLQN